MSYNIENLSFTIWGNGHDYTLLDSGEGNTQVFSHPFVPLNSVMYAGQWYFIVPDENGDAIDPIKDDLAHCTFTPALGAAFDTEGEIEVKCHYHREYVYGERTVIVDKEVKQIIEVVDHGNIARQAGTFLGTYYGSDIYEDGYCFFRPKNVNDLADVSRCTAWNDNSITKVSSLYWRITQLGDNGYFLSSNNLEDITEFEFADVSTVQTLSGLINGTYKELDLTPLEGWDVSNVTNVAGALFQMYHTTSLKGLEKWDTSGFNSLSHCFDLCYDLTDYEPLKDWDVSNVTDLSYCFRSNRAIESLDGLKDWDVSKVQNMTYAFYDLPNLADLSGLADWQTSSLTNLGYTFSKCGKLVDYVGLDDWDVSNVTNFESTFHDNGKVLSLEGVENWDTSSGTFFKNTFYGHAWVKNILPLKDWDLSNATNLNGFFGGNAWLRNVDGIVWTFKDGANLNGMFSGFLMYHSAFLEKDMYMTAYFYVDYEGNHIPFTVTTDAVSYGNKDASNASTWTVSGSGLQAFDNKWDNKPVWNDINS